MERTAWPRVVAAWPVAIVAAGACKSEARQAPPPPAAKDAALPRPAADRDPDDPGPVAVAGLPALDGGHGFVLAPVPGGTVTLAADGGGATALADGAVATQLEMPEGDPRDRGDDAVVYVEAAGTRGMLPARHFVTVDLIDPAPRAGWAVVRPQTACTADDCFEAVWLVHALAARWQLAPATVHTAVAWHPDGSALALSSDAGLAVVDLPAGTVRRRDPTLFSPAFAPDGTIYARSMDWHVWRVAPSPGAKPALVARGKDPFGAGPPGAPVIPPPPVDVGADGAWRFSQDELDAVAP